MKWFVDGYILNVHFVYDALSDTLTFDGEHALIGDKTRSCDATKEKIYCGTEYVRDVKISDAEIVNNNLTYDSNFSSKDVNNTTAYSMLIITLTKMTKFINNTINNETTTKYLNYSDLGTTDNYIIDNNNFNNIGLALFNQNNLSRISNNKFNTNSSNRYAIDFKGSTKCCLFNNIFDNFENPLNLSGNIIRFNNYYIYNDVVTKIMENPE